MFRRESRDERLERRVIGVGNFGTCALACAGLCLAPLVGCSDDSTAGVWSETESGQQASVDTNGDTLITVSNCSTGIPSNLAKADVESNCDLYTRTYAVIDVEGKAIDEDGNVIPNARVFLSNNGDYATTLKETTTDENGIYKFKKIIYKIITKDVEYLKYNLEIISNDSTLASYETIDLEDAEHVNNGTSVFLEVPVQTVHQTSSAVLKTYGYTSGRYVCLDNSNVCHTLTAEEVDAGTFTMEGIPEGIYKALCSQQTIDNMTDASCNYLDEILVTKPVVDTVSFAMPDEAVSLLDSLDDKTVENVLVPLNMDVVSPLLISGKDISVPEVIDGSVSQFWAEVSMTGSDTAVYKVVDDSLSENEDTNLFVAKSEIQDAAIDVSLLNSSLSNLGYSFKVNYNETDSKVLHKLLSVIDYTEDLTMGYEVAQCDSASKSVCVRVYSGLDSVATDTTIYGKADLLDGEEHLFSMAIAGTHLTVAVDGKILRDTDLKVKESFETKSEKGLLSGNIALIGSVTLKDFIIFRMDPSIHKSGESNWNRLKAWMLIHQMYSK